MKEKINPFRVITEGSLKIWVFEYDGDESCQLYILDNVRFHLGWFFDQLRAEAEENMVGTPLSERLEYIDEVESWFLARDLEDMAIGQVFQRKKFTISRCRLYN